MTPRYITRRKRFLPPTPGSSLRKERLSRGLAQEEVAKFFGVRGVCRERISQVEGMKSVPMALEVKYRAAVMTASTMRDQARAGHFENLKTAPSQSVRS
jgi:hypothetical protein